MRSPGTITGIPGGYGVICSAAVHPIALSALTGLAVIKAGRSEQVRAERILADRGTGPRVRAAALTMSRRGKPVPVQQVVVGQGSQDGRDSVIHGR